VTFFSCTLENWFSSEELNAMGVRLENSHT
jgi:hypothetical protein